MNTEKRRNFKNALQIGITCIGAYLVSYYMRNLLSVTSPEMLKTNLFTKEILGTFSSIYMVFYAIGQLLNGVMGDIIKPKKMVLLGMLLAGFAAIAFSFSNNAILQMALFGLLGFALSMLRGPLIKTVSENTEAYHARVICTLLSCASLAGPLIASLISMFFNWRKTFLVAGIIALIIGAIAFFVFTYLEKHGKLTYLASKKSSGFKNIFKVFSLKHFVFYLFVGATTEMLSSSVMFWLPTYLTEQLLLDANTAKLIFSAKSVIVGLMPFAALLIFNFFKGKDVKIIRFAFAFAALFFLGMRFFASPVINIALVLLAHMSVACAYSLLWGIYIPSQSGSGMVSSVNGVLDFSGYLAAAAANLLFAHSVEGLGWNGIILLWCGISVLGLIVSAFVKD